MDILDCLHFGYYKQTFHKYTFMCLFVDKSYAKCIFNFIENYQLFFKYLY